jgi:histidinol-phosphatase
MVTRSDIELAHRLASLAAEVALSYVPREVRRELKADGSLVSDADLAVEEALLSVLSDERPKDAVLSEERGQVSTAARRWILDPIDMTHEFLAGGRGWGTHVALEEDGELTLGIITRPTERLRWWAVRGEGAFLSDSTDPLSRRRRLAVSTTTSALKTARVSGYVGEGPAGAALSSVANWIDDEVSIIGALAEGTLDAVLDAGGQVWDHAPAALLVTEAGGRFSDPSGGSRLDRRWGLYTNGLLDDELRAVLAPHCPR